jgi:two-component system chemotaxis sensor kinase CheA
MNEVQSIIMKVRMVPVGNAFYKFTRVVRDLSKQVDKEIDLVIEGGETELDKTLVEEIGDPLVHLIRNSVDHGVEAPDAREAAGKPRKGTIRLKAAQDGNMIVITVRDDGKGLQTERIRNKAIAVGLIKETDQLSDKEIFNLIFEAGFSTADQVTNISGRGVGMDVVKKNIVKLKGVIELDSQLGKGTCTTIKLPLTLAIIPSLMIGVKGESYAIPLVNVIETIRLDPAEVQHVGASAFVKLREQVIPLMPLTDAFEMQDMDDRFWYRSGENVEGVTSRATLRANQTRGRGNRSRMIFVVVGVGEKRVGVVVDELLGQQEIVIKSLGRLMGRQRGVAGGCVLGNGRVALVLDAGEMIEDATFRKPLPSPGLAHASLATANVTAAAASKSSTGVSSPTAGGLGRVS